MMDSLSPKARKIVPSAIPASSAICRVVTSRPNSRMSGMTASTIIALRSSTERGRARIVLVSVTTGS
jgi:hypothetical protein